MHLVRHCDVQCIVQMRTFRQCVDVFLLDTLCVYVAVAHSFLTRFFFLGWIVILRFVPPRNFFFF